MTDTQFPNQNNPGAARDLQPIIRAGGVLFGLIYALSFALLIWGREGVLFARSSAEWPWLHLAAGLLPALLLGAAAGWIATLSSSMTWSVAIWILAGAAFGWLAGHVPCEGASFIAGLLDPRVAGLQLFPFTHSHEVRTWLVMACLGAVGAAAGVAQPQLVEALWDRLGPEGKEARGGRLWLLLGARAWLLLPMGMLLALLPMLAVNELLSNPRLTPLQRTDLLIQTALTGGEAQVQAEALNVNAVRRYGARFTPTYMQHFVEFAGDTETLYIALVDVDFDNGFVMRCSVIGPSVSSCVDASELYPVWMQALITGAREGTQPWRQLGQPLRVADAVETELFAHREVLTGTYTVQRRAQRGGMLWLEARFDGGTTLTCRFCGAMPVTVEACEVNAL